MALGMPAADVRANPSNYPITDAPPPEPSEDESTPVNEKQVALGTAIQVMAGFSGGPYERPERDTGYMSVAMPSGDQPMRLWWKGEVPADIAAMIEEARREFPIDVLPSERSRVEVKESTRPLARWLDPKTNEHMGQISGPTDVSVGGLIMEGVPAGTGRVRRG